MEPYAATQVLLQRLVAPKIKDHFCRSQENHVSYKYKDHPPYHHASKIVRPIVLSSILQSEPVKIAVLPHWMLLSWRVRCKATDPKHQCESQITEWLSLQSCLHKDDQL